MRDIEEGLPWQIYSHLEAILAAARAARATRAAMSLDKVLSLDCYKHLFSFGVATKLSYQVYGKRKTICL